MLEHQSQSKVSAMAAATLLIAENRAPPGIGPNFASAHKFLGCVCVGGGKVNSTVLLG